jgi:hypothetical protein
LVTVKKTRSAEATSILAIQLTAVAQLNQLAQRYTKSLVIKCLTERDEYASPEKAWTCIFFVNGNVRAKAVAKASKQEAMEAAAGETVAFLTDVGYK